MAMLKEFNDPIVELKLDKEAPKLDFNNIKPLGPNDKVSLDLKCSLLFSHDVAAIRPLFVFISLMVAENWKELTKDKKCMYLFAEKCNVLGDSHIRELVAMWEGETTKDAVWERFKTLLELKCLPKARGWSAITVDDLDVAKTLPLSELWYWPEFQPEILAKLLSSKQERQNLMVPRPESGPYLKRLLKDKLFNNGAGEFWTIFDEHFLELGGKRVFGLGVELSEFFYNVAATANSDWKRLLIIVRTEVLLRSILTNVDDEEVDKAIIKKSIDNLIRTRHLLLESDNEIVAHLLSIECVETNRALTKLEVDKNKFYIPNIKDKNASSAIKVKGEEETGLNKVDLTAINNELKEMDKGLLEQCLGNIILLYPVDNSQLKSFRSVIEVAANTAIRQLKQFLASYKDDAVTFDIVPIDALRWTTTILKSNPKSSKLSEDLAEIFKGRPKLKTSFLRNQMVCRNRSIAPAVFSLIDTVEELEFFSSLGYTNGNNIAPTISMTWKEGKYSANEFGTNIELEKPDYNYLEIIKIAEENLEMFCDYRMRLSVYNTWERTIDQGGLTNCLITGIGDFLFNESKLIIPTVKKEETKGGHDIQTFKFSLENDRKNGLFIGAFWQKTIQQEGRQPRLDDSIFKMLSSPPSDIKSKFNTFAELYKDELEKFKFLRAFDVNTIENIQYSSIPRNQFRRLLDPIPEQLSEDERDEKKRAIVYFRPEEIVLLKEEQSTITLEVFLEKNPELALKRVKEFCEFEEKRLFEEFVGFWNNFLKGFGVDFSVEGLPYLRNSNLLRDLVSYPAKLAYKELFESIKFQGDADKLVDSLISGLKITKQKVFEIFLECLPYPDLFQQFSYFWTGLKSATSELIVTFGAKRPAFCSLLEEDEDEDLMMLSNKTEQLMINSPQSGRFERLGSLHEDMPIQISPQIINHNEGSEEFENLSEQNASQQQQELSIKKGKAKTYKVTFSILDQKLCKHVFKLYDKAFEKFILELGKAAKIQDDTQYIEEIKKWHIVGKRIDYDEYKELVKTTKKFVTEKQQFYKNLSLELVKITLDFINIMTEMLEKEWSKRYVSIIKRFVEVLHRQSGNKDPLEQVEFMVGDGIYYLISASTCNRELSLQFDNAASGLLSLFLALYGDVSSLSDGILNEEEFKKHNENEIKRRELLLNKPSITQLSSYEGDSDVFNEISNKFGELKIFEKDGGEASQNDVVTVVKERINLEMLVEDVEGKREKEEMGNKEEREDISDEEFNKQPSITRVRTFSDLPQLERTLNKLKLEEKKEADASDHEDINKSEEKKATTGNNEKTSGSEENEDGESGEDDEEESSGEYYRQNEAFWRGNERDDRKDENDENQNSQDD